MKIFLQNQCMSLEEADFSSIEHNRNRRSIRGDDEITSEPWPILKPFRGSVGSGIIPNRIGQHGSRVNDGFYYKHKHTGTEDAQHVCMRMTAIQRLDCEEGEKRRGGEGNASPPLPHLRLQHRLQKIRLCSISYLPQNTLTWHKNNHKRKKNRNFCFPCTVGVLTVVMHQQIELQGPDPRGIEGISRD